MNLRQQLRLSARSELAQNIANAPPRTYQRNPPWQKEDERRKELKRDRVIKVYELEELDDGPTD